MTATPVDAQPTVIAVTLETATEESLVRLLVTLRFFADLLLSLSVAIALGGSDDPIRGENFGEFLNDIEWRVAESWTVREIRYNSSLYVVIASTTASANATASALLRLYQRFQQVRVKNSYEDIEVEINRQIEEDLKPTRQKLAHWRGEMPADMVYALNTTIDNGFKNAVTALHMVKELHIGE
jgi:hypothetical protein